MFVTGQNKLYWKADGPSCQSKRPQSSDTSWPASCQKVLYKCITAAAVHIWYKGAGRVKKIGRKA